MNPYLLFFIAIIPIVWLIISLGILKMKGYITCSITTLATVVLALVFWNMPPMDAATAVLEGFALAVWPILWVTVAAVFLYNVSAKTGSMEKIKIMLSGISTDKRVLVVLLAWGFGGFMEAIAGYGTAVAIPASILITMGFNPFTAVVVCLIANTAPTAFGAIGIPVITLANLTELNPITLSYTITIQLLLLITIIPFLLIFIVDRSFKAIKEVGAVALFGGLGFAVPQIFITLYLGPELAALLGSIVSMLMTVLAVKLFVKKEPAKNNSEKISKKEAFMACFTFILVFLFILLSSSLVPPVSHALAAIKTSVVIYTGEGAKPFTFPWIATPGSMIIIATFIGGLIQGFNFGRILKIFWETIVQLRFTIITILSIVAFSKVLGYSGMVTDIATVVASATNIFYPAIAPLIGALGTFLTGSDTSSNVLFGTLQKQVAENLSMSPNWLAAANTAGATAGKMISPQSIAVGAAATGLSGSEGKILNEVLKYCTFFIIVLGIIVFVGSLVPALLPG